MNFRIYVGYLARVYFQTEILVVRVATAPPRHVLRAPRRPRAGLGPGAARAGAGLRRGAPGGDSLHLGDARPARPGPLRDGRDGAALAYLPPGWDAAAVTRLKARAGLDPRDQELPCDPGAAG